MAFKYMEKEDRPFVKDMDTWSLYRMDGADRAHWVEIENTDSCVRIESQASLISEFEAKSLANALAQERAEDE